MSGSAVLLMRHLYLDSFIRCCLDKLVVVYNYFLLKSRVIGIYRKHVKISERGREADLRVHNLVTFKS